MQATTEELVLRPATNADASAVQALIFAVLEEYGLPLDPAGVDADLFDIESHYGESGACFDVLVTSSGRVVGTVALQRLDAVRCELRKMYLSPAIRGQGWGKALLARTLDHASVLGYEYVVLETASVLIEAIALYKHFGFTPLAGKPQVCRCDQVFSLSLAAYTPPQALRTLPVLEVA